MDVRSRPAYSIAATIETGEGGEARDCRWLMRLAGGSATMRQGGGKPVATGWLDG